MLRKLISICALGFATVAVAHATPITDGMTVTASQLSIGSSDVVGFFGSSIAPGTFEANYSETVYMGNSYCSSCLTFVYVVQNVGTSGTIAQATGSYYDSALTNVGFAGQGGTVDPATITRSSDGSFIAFTFDPDLAAGTLSDELVVQTNATVFGGGIFSLQGSTSGDNYALGPVPEPSSFMLLGTGLFALAGVAKRKFAL
jgi:hypothetical protein